MSSTRPPDSQGTGARAWLALLALVAGALAWRAFLIANRVLIETDGAHYGTLARHALEGGWRAALDPAWPPLYPWLVALAASVGEVADATEAVERAGPWVSALASSATVPIAFALTRRWCGPRTAFAGAALLAFHPVALRNGTALMSESLFACLFLAALYLWPEPRPGRRSRAGTLALGSGVLAALSVLARPEGWGLVLGLVLGAFLGGPAAARDRRRHLLLFVAPVALLTLPWLFWLRGELGGFGPGAKGPFNFHLAHAELYQAHGIGVEQGDVKSLRSAGTPFERGDYRVGELLRAAPGAVLWQAAGTVGRALVDKLPSLLGWLLVPFALLGLYGRRRLESGAGPRRVLLLLAITLVMLAPFFVLERLFLPYLPFLTLATALGMQRVVARFVSQPRQPLALGVLLGLTLLLFLGNSARRRHEREKCPLYREVGARLEQARLAGVKPEAAFYGRSEFRRLVEDRPDHVRAALQEAGATHLLLDDRHTPASLPRLLPWLEEGAAPDWLTERLELVDDRQRLVLWRVAGE